MDFWIESTSLLEFSNWIYGKSLFGGIFIAD